MRVPTYRILLFAFFGTFGIILSYSVGILIGIQKVSWVPYRCGVYDAPNISNRNPRLACGPRAARYGLLHMIVQSSHSRTPRRLALLAEVLRVEVGRVGVKVFVVVDAGDVDVQHFPLLDCDFCVRYSARLTIKRLRDDSTSFTKPFPEKFALESILEINSSSKRYGLGNVIPHGKEADANSLVIFDAVPLEVGEGRVHPQGLVDHHVQVGKSLK